MTVPARNQRPAQPPEARRASVGLVELRGALVLAMGVAGLGLMAYGAWLIYPPAAYIAAGVVLVGAARRMTTPEKETKDAR